MRKIVIWSFLSVPVLASIISTLHLVSFFALGNHSWMSYFLAVTFEVGSVASFVSLTVLDKVKKGMVMFIFAVLFILQLVGNVYFSFDYINGKLLLDPSWMSSFIEMARPIYDSANSSDYKFMLALIIGVPVPLVSISFLKSLVDYISSHPKDAKPVEPVTEPVEPVEPVIENESTNLTEPIVTPVHGVVRDGDEFKQYVEENTKAAEEVAKASAEHAARVNDDNSALYQNQNGNPGN